MSPSAAFRPPDKFVVIIDKGNGEVPVIEIRFTYLIQHDGYFARFRVYPTNIQFIPRAFHTLHVEVVAVFRGVQEIEVLVLPLLDGNLRDFPGFRVN